VWPFFSLHLDTEQPAHSPQWKPRQQLREEVQKPPKNVPSVLRFHDFNIWSHAKKKEKPWSSFSFYAHDKQGLIRIDPVY
jgi:hypothetical protein